MISLVLLLCAQDLKVPAEVRGEVAAFITVVAETDGKSVKFVPLDAGLSVFPAGLLANPKATVVTSARPGSYRLLSYTAKGDVPSEPQTTLVVIGGQPIPPKPPEPFVPVPPAPDDVTKDPLFDALVGIYGGIQESDKQQRVKLLANVFKQAADLAGQHQTVGALYGAIRNLSNAALAPDAVRPIRDRVAVESVRALGDNPGAAVDAAKARAHFLRVAKVLEALAQ